MSASLISSANAVVGIKKPYVAGATIFFAYFMIRN
tara:strand:+ start:1680 stop:1784 length:105 start_codon:yes stop_codon:yes gene_type:complete